MATFAELIAKNSQLNKDEIDHLSELVAEWRLLADLSFADLLLWLPIRKDEKSWPDGYVLVAQIRPTTAATVFNDDLVGTEMAWGINSRVDYALANGEILRDTQPEKVGDLLIKEETIPSSLPEKLLRLLRAIEMQI
jgi:two-component system, sensor histidine kinase PdtaS